MRIALLMGLAPRKLGAFEDWVLAFCEEAKRRQHQVDVFGLAPSHPEFTGKLSQLGGGWHDLQSLKMSPLLGIQRLRTYDILYLTLLWYRDPIALLAYAAVPAAVMILEQSSGELPWEEERRLLAKDGVSRQLRRLIGVRLSAIAAVSSYVADRERLRFGIDHRKVRTIYHGVDVDRFNGSGPVRSPTSGVTVLSVAHLIPQKGIEYLLRAFVHVRQPTARLLIAGDGPLAQPLKRLTRDLGLEPRVSFLGLRDDVNELLGRADIFVHPAIWSEAFGLTIAEAMSSERAVVASRVGGIPELIEDGRSGLTVKPADAPVLADALNRLIEDASYRLELARNARLRAISKFSLPACIAAHLELCAEIAAKRRLDRRPRRS